MKSSIHLRPLVALAFGTSLVFAMATASAQDNRRERSERNQQQENPEDEPRQRGQQRRQYAEAREATPAASEITPQTVGPALPAADQIAPQAPRGQRAQRPQSMPVPGQQQPRVQGAGTGTYRGPTQNQDRGRDAIVREQAIEAQDRRKLEQASANTRQGEWRNAQPSQPPAAAQDWRNRPGTAPQPRPGGMANTMQGRDDDVRGYQPGRNDDRRPDSQRQYDRRDDDRRNQQRLSREQQERRIRDERQWANRHYQDQQRHRYQAELRARELQQQRRLSQYRYQQDYYDRLRRQQSQWLSVNYNYYNDPYYYTPASYRYNYGGRWYETNRYGADLMRQAINYGYQEGLRAARADRQDRWRNDYRNSYAYQDASYGYHGRYLVRDQYAYYFRQGFERGYEDGYRGQYRYGQRRSDGTYAVVATVLSVILGLQLLR